MTYRKVSSEAEMEHVIREMTVAGYQIKEKGRETALLKHNTWGSSSMIIVTVIIALVFALFTLGLSFLLPFVYVIYKHQSADELLIEVDQSVATIDAGIEPQVDIPAPQVQPPPSNSGKNT